MTGPIISPWFFYLFNVFGNLSLVISLIAVVGALVAAVLGITVLICFDSISWEDLPGSRVWKIIKKCFVIWVSSLVLSIFIPSETTVMQMFVSSMVTYENVDAAGEVSKDILETLSDFIVDTANGIKDDMENGGDE